MSVGYGGIMKKSIEDSNTIIYVYSGYNLNSSEYAVEKYDGYITISKTSFVEPNIREKIKKIKGRKKIIKKRILTDVDLEALISQKLITVENCSNCWETTLEGIDYIALRLISKLYNEYQLQGEIPIMISLHC